MSLKTAGPHVPSIPPYRQMITTAINSLSFNESVSSFQAIVKYLLDNYQVRQDNCAVQVKRAIGKMLKCNDVIKTGENYSINDGAQDRRVAFNDYFSLPRKCKSKVCTPSKSGSHSFHINLSNRSGAKFSRSISLNDFQECRPVAIISTTKLVKVEIKRVVCMTKICSSRNQPGVNQDSPNSYVVGAEETDSEV